MNSGTPEARTPESERVEEIRRLLQAEWRAFPHRHQLNFLLSVVDAQAARLKLVEEMYEALRVDVGKLLAARGVSPEQKKLDELLSYAYSSAYNPSDEHLQKTVAHLKAEFMAALDAQAERIRELEQAVLWALGEGETFPPMPPIDRPFSWYYWRPELRERAFPGAARTQEETDGR